MLTWSFCSQSFARVSKRGLPEFFKDFDAVVMLSRPRADAHLGLFHAEADTLRFVENVSPTELIGSPVTSFNVVACGARRIILLDCHATASLFNAESAFIILYCRPRRAPLLVFRLKQQYIAVKVNPTEGVLLTRSIDGYLYPGDWFAFQEDSITKVILSSVTF